MSLSKSKCWYSMQENISANKVHLKCGADFDTRVPLILCQNWLAFLNSIIVLQKQLFEVLDIRHGMELDSISHPTTFKFSLPFERNKTAQHEAPQHSA
jgi:hypothetical protein